MLTYLTSLGLANYLWAVAKMHYRMLDKQPELLTASLPEFDPGSSTWAAVHIWSVWGELPIPASSSAYEASLSGAMAYMEACFPSRK